MAARNGKISQLPNEIREQLNLRLLEGESGRELTAWLNALPEVQSIPGSQFNGSPVSEVNLTLWRQGGYLQWLTERECFDSARALADGDCDLATTGLSAERLLNVLTVRFGQLLMRWDFSPDESVSSTVAFREVAKKARILQGISRAVLAIHRIQSRSALAKNGAVNSSPNSGAALNSSADAMPSEANGDVPVGAWRQPSFSEKAPFDGLRALSSSKRLAIERNGASHPQALSGPILPPIAPSKIAHTPLKADLDLSGILHAL